MKIFFFQAEGGIRDFCLSRGLGDVYKKQHFRRPYWLTVAGVGNVSYLSPPPTPQYDPSSSRVVRNKAFLHDEARPPRVRGGRWDLIPH